MSRMQWAVLVPLLSAGCGILDDPRTRQDEQAMFVTSPEVDVARAVRRGRTGELKKLLKGGVTSDLESRPGAVPWGRDNATLLLWAIMFGQVESAETLIESGADPNKPSKGGMAPLALAVLQSDDRLYELLLRRGAEPNATSEVSMGDSALVNALRKDNGLGDRRFVRAKVLLDKGAQPDLLLRSGQTTLTKLATRNDWQAVLWLLENGANFELRDRHSATAMCYLRSSIGVAELGFPGDSRYRAMVRDWFLAHGVARNRVDPRAHRSSICDD